MNNNRIVLKATEGYIITDGNCVYGTTIYLAEDRNISDFHEITMEEYEEIMKQQEEDMLI